MSNSIEITFRLRALDGKTLLTGQIGILSFLAFQNPLNGSDIAMPSFVELGRGLYAFTTVGPVNYVINCGPGALPQQLEGEVETTDFLADNLDTAISETITELDMIKAKTDNLPLAPASTTDVTAARDSIDSKLGTPAGASISADIASIKGDVGPFSTKLATIRALLGSNVFVDNATFDNDGNPTGDRSRYYARAEEAQDPENSVPIITLIYSATWSGPGRIITELVIVTQGS